MRIIAGMWRSRLLQVPKTPLTRPMPDRVKESIFNKLGSHYGTPGGLPALRTADVFAGGGGMGLEAISRGAMSCHFFERDADCLATLRLNLDRLGAGPEAIIVRGDAWRRAAATFAQQPFDLVLLDPPFRDSADATEGGEVRRFLRRLRANEPSEILVVLHHESDADYSPCAEDGWKILDVRSFGRNVVTFLT